MCSKQAFTALHLSLHQLAVLQGLIQTPASQLFYSNSDFFLFLHYLPISCHLNVQCFYLVSNRALVPLRNWGLVLFAFLKMHPSSTVLGWLFSVFQLVYYWMWLFQRLQTSEWTQQQWLKSIIAVSLMQSGSWEYINKKLSFLHKVLISHPVALSSSVPHKGLKAFLYGPVFLLILFIYLFRHRNSDKNFTTAATGMIYTSYISVL